MLLLGLALLAAALPCARQARAQREVEWSLLDGLPTTVITAVLQDGEGFVWIGTHVGLARSDGHTVEVFRPDARVPGALISAVVNVGALLEARDGTLWIGTREGLCRRRPTSTLFDCVGHDPRDPSSLADGNVVALAEAPDGTIWAGTTGGLHAVDPATLRVRRFGESDGLPYPYVSALAVASDGTLWAGTSRGLAVLPPSSRAFRPVQGLPNDTFVHALLPSPTGGMWVGTLGHGLFHAGNSDTPVAPLPLGESAGVSPAQSGVGHVVALHTDPSGRLWIGTWGGGLLLYDPLTGSLDRFTARPGASHALPSDEVVALEVDADGGVWAATWGGLAHRPPRPPYRLLTHDPEDPTSLSSPRITRLLPAPSGELWVGTFGGGLNRCDPASFRCRRYQYDSEDPTSLCHDTVLDLALDASGALWIATSGAGVCRFDPRTETFSPAIRGAPPELRSAHVYALAIDPPQDVWMGTAEDGLAHVLTPTGTTVFAPRLAESSVFALARSPKGELWAGTLGSGLCRTTDGVTFDCFRPESHGLADDWVTALATAPGGLWAGGTRGLDWIPHGGRPQRVLDEDDLPRPHVSCILSTASGTWVATASGILRLDLRSREVTADAAAAGLPAEGFLRPACTQLGPNLLAFGTEQGVVFFRPGDVTSVRPSPTRVTALRVDGEEAVPGVPAHLIRSLTLGPDQSGPSFRFATLNYAAPDARRYVYRLDGFDASWSRPTDHAEAAYPKLPPGRYTFRVRPALQPLAAEASVELLVLAPVWQRPWFIALAVALVTALGVGAYRTRVAYLLRIERTRRSIADDLHDDVGSRLGGLALALDVAARTLNGPARAEVHARAEEARALLSDLRDTVWVVEGRLDTLADLVHRIRLSAETLLPDARVLVTTEGDLDRPLSMETRRHLLFFCKEALHNASRHGRPDAVRITFVASAGRAVSVEIEDDGCGFDPTNGQGRGMGSLQRRSEALGGALDVTSAPGNGTTVSLSFEA